MYWIALLPPHEDERTAWGWHALQFTPRVAQVEEALLLEASASEQLFGGRRRLLRRLLQAPDGWGAPAWAQGASSLVALALLRLKQQGAQPPAHIPDGLPLDLLSAARPHGPTLERIGCRSWGELRALPRAGLSRRFGAALLQALDCAYGEQAESYPWLELPEQFDLKLELPALATTAPELMWAGQRLLSQLQLWLSARQLGVLALELEWTLDLRRLNGKPLPPTETLPLRTAQPTQDMAHLRRLMGEHLARTPLAAPVNHLRLRTLETLPWGGATTSLLPEERRKGEPLHQLVERLSVRLGEHNVCVARPLSDHRPERMQRWQSARGSDAIADLIRNPGPGCRVKPGMTSVSDPLYPTWLLPRPLQLEVRGDTVWYDGPLQRLARLYRVETGWWEEGGPAVRDYFIARGERAGLVWIYHERPLQSQASRWFLQGLYA